MPLSFMVSICILEMTFAVTFKYLRNYFCFCFGWGFLLLEALNLFQYFFQGKDMSIKQRLTALRSNRTVLG